jgi:hypothetical protein
MQMEAATISEILCDRLHDVTSQKAVILIVTAILHSSFCGQP